MPDFKARLEHELVAAAGRPRRVRYARGPLPTHPLPWLAATATAIALAAVLGLHASAPRSEHPAAKPTPTPTPAPRARQFDRQLRLLGILRNRTSADNDPQVHAAVRDYTRAGMPVRTGYARLLAKAPSRYAFALLPVLEFDRNTLGLPAKMQTIQDGICLVRRGSQGGAGQCMTTDELAKGELWFALAGQVYGVVPDSVAAVRPKAGAKPVDVRRNFFVYPAPKPRIGKPIFLDAQGREINLGFSGPPGGP
jgi:hypothetical protein